MPHEAAEAVLLYLRSGSRRRAYKQGYELMEYIIILGVTCKANDKHYNSAGKEFDPHPLCRDLEAPFPGWNKGGQKNQTHPQTHTQCRPATTEPSLVLSQRQERTSKMSSGVMSAGLHRESVFNIGDIRRPAPVRSRGWSRGWTAHVLGGACPMGERSIVMAAV